MAKVLVGRAAIFGVDGTVSYTGLAATEAEIQSTTLTDEFDVVEIQDNIGETIGMAAKNPRQSIQIDFIPTDTTGDSPQSYTDAKAKVVLPTPLATVALSSDFPTNFQGNWHYVGNGSIGITSEGYIRMSLTLRRFAGAAFGTVS